MKQWRVLLVDDHEVVRIGLKDLIKSSPSLEVVAEATSEMEAVQKALTYKPDIVLMDLRLLEGSGIAACRQITRQLPDTKVIVLTAFAEDALLDDAIGAGAVAYVLKQASNEQILDIIKMTANSKTARDPSSVRDAFAEMHHSIQANKVTVFDELTSRELEVLDLIALGKTNREIARSLQLSESTTSNYTSSIITKLEISNRAEAAAYAIRYRLKDYL